MTSESAFKPVVEKARVEDAAFIGICARNAERAHTGRGFYDCMLNGTPHDGVDIAPVLAHAAANAPASIIHYSKFRVIRNEDGVPVAGLCGFMYPEAGLGSSKPGINAAIVDCLSFKGGLEAAAKCWENVKWLGEGFPEGVDFEDNTWMIECVYTEPAYRGKGYAKMLLEHIFEEGGNMKSTVTVAADGRKGAKRCMMSCADGNDKAKAVYQQLGWEVLGAGPGYSEGCMRHLGSGGFYMLGRNY